MAFNIVLVEPEIPQNTGNVARTCAVTGTRLHLIKPYGFRITDKNLKRAGLDYWHLLDITEYDSIEDFFNKNKGSTFYYATSKGRNRHSDVKFKDGDFILFGKETKGLDEKLLKDNEKFCIRIPMVDDARCLNLANSAAVVVYEALRQNNYFDLETEGSLTKYNWDDWKHNNQSNITKCKFVKIISTFVFTKNIP